MTQAQQDRITKLENLLWELAESGRDSLEMYDATHTVFDTLKHLRQQIKSLTTKWATVQ